MNRLLTIAFLACCVPALASAQENKPKPLKLLILDHPTSTGQPDVLARVLAQSPNIQRMDAKSFWANTTITPSVFKSEASIKKAQSQLGKSLAAQGIETIFVWRSDPKGSTIWVIGPAGKWRGDVGRVWSTGRASQVEVQALLKQGFGLSAPVVLAWRKQQKNSPKRPKIIPKQPKTPSPKRITKTTPNTTTQDPIPATPRTTEEPKATTNPTKPAQPNTASKPIARKTTPKTTPQTTSSQGRINKQAQPKRQASHPSTILNVSISPSFRTVNESATVAGRSNRDNVPQQRLLGISTALAVAIFLSPTVALQPRLNFDYHTGEVTTAGQNVFANMNMTETELLMDVLLFFNTRHQLSAGLGSLISRWSFLELYPNTLTDTFTASALLDINYSFWPIEQFMVLNIGASVGVPMVGEYGPSSQQLNSATLTRTEFGMSVRILRWLWANANVNGHFQFSEYSIFPPENPTTPTTIQSDWVIVDLKLGFTGVW